MIEDYRCLVADLQEQCKRKDDEIAILKRMVDLMASELSCVEIAPPICEGCKEIGGFYNGSCSGKECILWMFERTAKGLDNYAVSK